MLKCCLLRSTPGRPMSRGILTCLSCHDGNWAKGAMMQNKVYETVPSTYASNNIPTLLGNDGNGTGDYLNDHPVGLNAVIGCGGQYNWDCTVVNGAITYPSGTKMYQFVQNYGFFVSPAAYNGNPVVLCTTCHNQHLMNVVKVTTGSKSGLRLAITRRCSSSAHPTTPLRPLWAQTRRRSSAVSAMVAKPTK